MGPAAGPHTAPTPAKSDVVPAIALFLSRLSRPRCFRHRAAGWSAPRDSRRQRRWHGGGLRGWGIERPRSDSYRAQRAVSRSEPRSARVTPMRARECTHTPVCSLITSTHLPSNYWWPVDRKAFQRLLSRCLEEGEIYRQRQACSPSINKGEAFIIDKNTMLDAGHAKSVCRNYLQISCWLCLASMWPTRA